MAAHYAEQRQIHRRVAKAQVEVAPRYEATACYPGEKHCHVREAETTTRIPRPTDDWFTFLFPDETTSTTFSTPVPSSSSSSVLVLPTSTKSSSSSTTHRSSSTHKRSTSILVRTQTAVGAARSASPSAVPSGNTSTGAVVGGIAGGVIGFALLLSLVAFIMRRMRRKRDDLEPFNTTDFRKSAVLLEDPPTHQDTINAGFNPRPPPTMSERRPPTFGTLYGSPGPNYTNMVTTQSPTTENYGPYSPHSPSSANPFITTASYTPNPFSPGPSPIEESSPVPHLVLTRTSSAGHTTLSRKSSGKTIIIPDGAAQSAQYPPIPDSLYVGALPSNDYVDLSRSSVTPFQAAQYAEISQRIGTEVPTGLSTPLVDEHLKNIHAVNGDDDDDTPPPPPEKDHPSNFMSHDEVDPTRFSAATDQSDVLDTAGLDFPVPPSPSLSSVTRYRIDSTPPVLPDIRVESRASFGTPTLSPFGTYDFPSSAVSSVFPSGIISADQVITVPVKPYVNYQGSFPTTPSPQASSFSLASESTFDSAPPTRPVPSKLNQVVTRPETVYDPEDVYGGI